MAYIGNSPANVGNYQLVDDIASGFNGSLVSFALASGGIAITPAKSGQILANINGVMQEPDDGGTNGFKVTGSNIVFSSAPANGDTFWAVYQGQNVDIGTPSDDVVDTAHIKDDAVTAAKLANSINTAIAANTAKTGITTSQASAITANTAKTGITSSQSSAITANTAKTGITSSQATAITAALPKGGGTMTGTTAHGDNIKSRYGTNADLEIYHDGSHSYIDDSSGTGRLILKTDYLEVQNAAGNEAILGGIQDGAVSLYHNGLAKLATTAAGVAVTGGVGIGTTSAAGFNLDLQDSNYGVRIRAVPASKFVQVQLPTDEGSAVDNEKFIIAYNNAHSGHPHMVALKSNNSAGTVGFFTNNAERVRIQSGGGISFNGDTAVANALDDYEEGTWTPTVTGGSMGTLVRGSYTKIGNKVWLYTYMNFTAPNNTTMFQIKGIPYTPGGHMHAGGSVEYLGGRNFTHWSAPLIDGAGIYFHRKDGSSATILNNEFGGNSQVIIVSVTYTTS